MNPRVSFLKLFLPAAALCLAAPLALRAAPAAATPPGAAAAAEGVLPDNAVARPGGGYLALSATDDSHFQVKFYDKHKQPVAPDVARGFMRYDSQGHRPESTVLNPNGDDSALVSAQTIRGRPRVFKVFLFLFQNGSDQAVENYTLDFSG